MTLPEPPCKVYNPETLISNSRSISPLKPALRTVCILKCTSICQLKHVQYPQCTRFHIKQLQWPQSRP